MNNSVAAKPIEYRDLIKEVYIDPIRTVVVIDDEFPSLDGLIAEKWYEENGKCGTKEDADKVRDILAACRHKDRRWLVDVHDGKKISTDDDQCIASHLHQSDLMILDYHLDGNEGSGDKAIAILRELATNDHFNMVIVYTKGYGNDAGDLDCVIREIALGLTSNKSGLVLNHQSLNKVTEYLEEWEDEEEGITDKLKATIDENAYLAVNHQLKIDWKKIEKTPEFQEAVLLFESNPNKPSKFKNSLFLRWLVHEQQKKLESKLSSNNLGHVGFRYSENGINWIRTSRLFITVIHKEQNTPDSLPDKLVEALNHWQPEPHRLLMAKMRAALDTRGALAEEEVLDNPCLQAAWFEELLIEDASQRKLNVNKTIERHWEGLGDSVQAEVASFTSKMTDYLCDLDPVEAYKIHCPDGSNSNKTENLAAANCYHCTKAIEGNHLTTGHVLKIGAEFWLCLSPACDLEPGQEKGWLKSLKPNMPFKAVQLHNADIENALKNVNY
ncbi:response regulator receiver domain [Methylobacter svalbardensis]|uniref:response regulator receiver domain n=1 Tax=Methylobacter svalbardensis TaxID=3080016 RepID=UPI0030EF8553